MTKIININTGKERVIEPPKPVECTICKTEFSLESEGGIEGSFGMIAVSFCPFCLSSVLDMSKQLLGVKEK